MAQSLPDFIFVGAFHDEEGSLTLAKRPAHDHHPLIDEPIHEGGMLVPGVLLAVGPRSVPLGYMHHGQHEEGHQVSLGTSRRLDPVWVSAESTFGCL